jgi:hypothetical protein
MIEADFPDAFDAILCTYYCDSGGGAGMGDTPLPLWAILALGSGLLGTVARNRKRA